MQEGWQFKAGTLAKTCTEPLPSISEKNGILTSSTKSRGRCKAGLNAIPAARYHCIDCLKHLQRHRGTCMPNTRLACGTALGAQQATAPL